MGGKRSDQYEIDPGEAGATDYKDRRIELKVADDEHQKLAQHTGKHEPKIPHSVDNPALADLKARRAKKRDADAGEE